MTTNRTNLAIPIAVIAALTIAAAWGFERAGYPPCELCYKERIPYYAGVPLAALVAWMGGRGRDSLLPAGFAALVLIFGAGAILGSYHTGVEWGWWQGPSSCTGGIDHPAAVTDFLQQLNTTQVVRCDAPALKVAGLSLAAWNAGVCILLTVLAAVGFRAPRGASVSAR